MFYSLIAAILSFQLHVTLGAISKDFVPAMPGYDKQLPSKWYSGYLDIPGGKHIHYLFIESMNAPATDPIHLW